MSSKLEITPKIENLQELINTVGNLNKNIGDQGDVVIASAKAEAGIHLTSDIAGTGTAKVKFDLTAGANASIEVYNAANDKDADGVFGAQDDVEKTKRADAANKFAEITIPPALLFDKKLAWTKFRVEGRPVLKVNIPLPMGGVKLDADAGVVFADYHRHKASETILGALTGDVQNLRIAADVDHIVGLPEGDALSYGVRGALEASINLKWSDTFVYAVSEAAALLGPGETLSFDVGASASFNFSVFIKDDFRMIFTRQGTQNRVAVLKAKSQKLSVGVEAAIQVQITEADRAKLNKEIDRLVAAITKVDAPVLAEIDKMVAQVASFGGLTDAQQQIIRELAARLGLAQINDTIDAFEAKWEAIKKKWKDIRDRIPNILKAAVDSKVKLAFKYEYVRTCVNEELLVALLTDQSLRDTHRDLMVFSTDSTVAAAQTAGNELVTYLNQRSTNVRQAWGFTLNVGKWTMSGNDRRELDWKVQRNAADERRVAFDALRGYEAKTFGGNTFGWIVDLKAEMNGFAKELDHKTLDYGLSLKYFSTEKTMNTDERREYLDFALLWDSLTIQELSRQFDDKVPAGTTGEITSEIILDDTALRGVVKKVHELRENDEEELNRLMARSFARALPFDSNFGALRVAPENRANAYTALWGECLKENPPTGGTLRNMVINTLNQVNPDGAELEKLLEASRGTSFVRQVQAFPDAGKSMRAFLKGMEKLHGLLFEDEPDEFGKDKLTSAYKSLRDLWDQSLYVRATGAFLLDVARKDEELYARIKRTTTIKTTKGGETKVKMLSTGATR